MTKRILLIDDEPDITYTIKNVLEDSGFKVDCFNHPIIALESYRDNFYDLVILDIKMPKMDGFELYIKLREKDSRTKICFLTANELFYEEFRKIRFNLGEEIGEEYFILKPIKTDVLFKKIDTLIMNE